MTVIAHELAALEAPFTVCAPVHAGSPALASVPLRRFPTFDQAQSVAARIDGAWVMNSMGERWDGAAWTAPRRGALSGVAGPSPARFSRENPDAEQDLIELPDGSFTVGDRGRDLAAVGVDTLRTLGRLGRLSPKERRVREAFRDPGRNDHERAPDLFEHDEDGHRSLVDGYRIEHTGRTHAPVGRPRLGTEDPREAARLLEVEDGRPIAELRTLVGR